MKKPKFDAPIIDRPKAIKAINKAWYRSAHGAKRKKAKSKRG